MRGWTLGSRRRPAPSRRPRPYSVRRQRGTRDGGWPWTRRWRRWHTCQRAKAGGSNRRQWIMQTHTHRAHWYAQETVAKTILAAAHAKRLAAQWRLSHVRWATYRWRAAAAWWGKA